MVGNAVVGPLSKGADVLGDSAGIEQAEFLEHYPVVLREITRIGTGGAVGIGRRDLQHRSERQLRRRAVALHREGEPRSLLFHLLHERIPAELEFPAYRAELEPTKMAVTAFQTGLASKAWHCLRQRRGQQQRRD